MQSVIAYRNPVEAAFWQFLTSGSYFPVLVGLVVFFAVFVASDTILCRIYGSWGKTGEKVTASSLVVGAIAGIGTIWYFVA